MISTRMRQMGEALNAFHVQIVISVNNNEFPDDFREWVKQQCLQIAASVEVSR
jgi:hypothetical protein